jgi:hypothetical protein
MSLCFELAKQIEWLWRAGQTKIFIVHGILGAGKSSYTCQVLAETYGDHSADPRDEAHWNWEAVKSRIVFRPEEFMAKIEQMEEEERRDKVLLWDDAGYWLTAKKWHDPLIMAVGEYLNVSRYHFSAFIFTSPAKRLIFRTLRDFPGTHTVHITQRKSDYVRQIGHRGGPRTPGAPTEVVRPRLARIFGVWRSEDEKKSGTREVLQDIFNATLPDDFFRWYDAYRRSFGKIAIQMLRKTIDQVLANVPQYEDRLAAGKRLSTMQYSKVQLAEHARADSLLAQTDSEDLI